MAENEFYKEYFKSRFTYDKNRDIVWREICRYLQKYIPKNSNVLDIGAGYCTFINNIEAKEKHALDIFADLKKYANKDVIKHKVPSSNMKGISSNYFDIVFASNFFEHLRKNELESTIMEVRRVLKKKGLLIIIQPNFKYCYKEYFDDYTHKTVFTEISMSDFLENFRFKIEKNIPRFLPFSMKSRLPKIGFIVSAYLYLPIRPFAKQMLIIAKKK